MKRMDQLMQPAHDLRHLSQPDCDKRDAASRAYAQNPREDCACVAGTAFANLREPARMSGAD